MVLQVHPRARGCSPHPPADAGRAGPGRQAWSVLMDDEGGGGPGRR